MADYTDPFSGGTPGATIVGANWAGNRAAPGGFQHWVYATGGESVEPDTDGVSLGVRYIGGSFTASQYSAITLAQDSQSGGSICYPGANVRCSGVAGTSHCYKFGWYVSNWFIATVINGTETNIGVDVSGAPTSLPLGTVLRVEVEDSGTVATIRGYYDGTLVITRTHDHGGGTLAAGTAGFEAYNSGATLGKIGSWAGGDLSSAATAVTLTGPSAGTVGVASTNFMVGANGAITGTVVVTPNDGGDGGTFTPTSVSISSGTPTQTFTYTPASVGAKTISVTNDGGLSNPSSITYTASAAAATSLVVTVPDAASLTGFTAFVLSAAAPGTGVSVILVVTGVSFNGAGQATLDITGLGVSIGAYRWVSVTNSDGTPGQTPAPVQAQGPVQAS